MLMDQKLLGHPAFGKFLELAEKSGNPELVQQVADHRALQKLATMLNSDEEPDFAAFTKFLQENPKMQGGEVLNALWMCSQWLAENDRKEDAKGFLQRMLADPLVQENKEGIKMIEKAIHTIDHETGDAEEGHDHDGDGIPDH